MEFLQLADLPFKEAYQTYNRGFVKLDILSQPSLILGTVNFLKKKNKERLVLFFSFEALFIPEQICVAIKNI